MKWAIRDVTARKFAQSFYKKLASGLTSEVAFTDVVTELRVQHSGDADAPVFRKGWHESKEEIATSHEVKDPVSLDRIDRKSQVDTLPAAGIPVRSILIEGETSQSPESFIRRLQGSELRETLCMGDLGVHIPSKPFDWPSHKAVKDFTERVMKAIVSNVGASSTRDLAQALCDLQRPAILWANVLGPENIGHWREQIESFLDMWCVDLAKSTAGHIVILCANRTQASRGGLKELWDKLFLRGFMDHFRAMEKKFGTHVVALPPLHDVVPGHLVTWATERGADAEELKKIGERFPASRPMQDVIIALKKDRDFTRLIKDRT
jgi:hypothetical protein